MATGFIIGFGTAPVQGDFIAQVACRADFAAQTADETPSFTLVLFRPRSGVVQEADHREARGGRSRAQRLLDRRARLRRQIGVVEEEGCRRAAERERDRLGRRLIRGDVDILAFEEELCRRREFVAGEQRRIVTLKARQQHRAFDAAGTAATQHAAAIGAKVDRRVVAQQRTVRSEHVVVRDTAAGRAQEGRANERTLGCVTGSRGRAGKLHGAAERCVAEVDAGIAEEILIRNAVRRVADIGIAVDDAARDRVARRIERALDVRIDRREGGHAAESAGLTVAVREQQGARVRIAARNGDVAAAVGEVLTVNAADLIRTAVATRRDAALRVEGKAVIVALEDEVDDARNGVRTVNGRVAAGHEVDALQKFGRNGVRVDAIGARRRRDLAAAVNQHQRAVGTQTAKVEQVQTRGADRGGRVCLSEGRTELRQAVQHVAERQFAGFEQVFRAHARDRNRCVEVGTIEDARPGNDDDTSVFGFGAIRRSARVLRDRRHGTEQSKRQGRAPH